MINNIDKTTIAVDNMAFAIGTAFEDAIIGGKGFSDVLKGLADDITRIAIRAAITKPLEGFLGGIFGGFSMTGVLGGIGKFLGFKQMGTDYVPYTGLAVLHEGEKVIPKGGGEGGGQVIELHITNLITPGFVNAAINEEKGTVINIINENTVRRGITRETIRKIR